MDLGLQACFTYQLVCQMCTALHDCDCVAACSSLLNRCYWKGSSSISVLDTELTGDCAGVTVATRIQVLGLSICSNARILQAPADSSS